MPLLTTPFNESKATLSSDGRYIAYQSNESGRNEVYVRPFPQVDTGRWQVSVGGGGRPVWTRGGREILYIGGEYMMAVSVRTAPGFSAAPPTRLFEDRYLDDEYSANYDVSSDGTRLLKVKPGNGQGARLVIVVNWRAGLKH